MTRLKNFPKITGAFLAACLIVSTAGCQSAPPPAKTNIPTTTAREATKKTNKSTSVHIQTVATTVTTATTDTTAAPKSSSNAQPVIATIASAATTMKTTVAVAPRTTSTTTSQNPTKTAPSRAPAKTPEALLASMTLEEMVGQMFMVRCPASGAEKAVSRYKIGGYILFGRDFSGRSKQQVIDNIRRYQQNARIPLLIGVDEEGGKVNRVSPYFRATPFLSPQDLFAKGGMPLIASDTKEKADLLHSLGINVNFAPVCDVSTHANDYIYARTFGKNGQETASYVRTVVSAMRQKKMGSVLKHFPGYGNNKDTHTGIAYDNRPYSTFENNDFLPFQAGIGAGADCVLVSHNIVSCMDKRYPASLSPEVHRILRDKLGFTGVIITDDLVMQAIKQYTGDSDAAVVAVQAGNDMLCCTNFEEQIPAVIRAVKNGTLSQQQIKDSVRRILRWKQSLGLLA